MKVLIGCEESGTVRDAFLALGHDAISCDILPTSNPGPHIQGDVFEVLASGAWDLVLLHPPCTAMALCGNKHYWSGGPRYAERLEAIAWTKRLWETAKACSARVAAENPASVVFQHLKAPVQYVQPWQFGHLEQKRTGLALHNLPRLTPTKDVYDEMMVLPRKERERGYFL